MSKTADFICLVVAPGGPGNASLAVAASRAGAVGIIDLEYSRDAPAANLALSTAAVRAGGNLGIRVDGSAPDSWKGLLSGLPKAYTTAILTFCPGPDLRQHIGRLREKKLTVFVDVTSLDEAIAAQKAGADGLIARGNEAGGRVSDRTTFILLQEIAPRVKLPVLACGGVGIHTAAACWVGGAAGVVLDWQLALVRESALPEALRSRIPRMDGRETRCFGQYVGQWYRLLAPGLPATAAELETLEESLLDRKAKADRLTAWREAVVERVLRPGGAGFLPMSQDVSFASRLARKFRTAAGVIDAIRDGVASHVEAAQRLKPLAEGQGSAQVLGIRFPVIQGPMSRVSETPAFAAAIAGAGGLPVMAGAMMAADELKPMLEQTREQLGSRPWGIGLLGFLDSDFYSKQVDLVKQSPPAAAVIAGGSPAQAAAFEAAGVRAYIHVPAPQLLPIYLQEGVRNLIFEGRECGGHVGPYAGFVLWESAIETLLDEVAEADAPRIDVWFAGGIHDAVSSSMIAAMIAPLAERGMHVGVLLATAYLFTEEAVRTGAIGGVYRQCLLDAGHTDILDSGGGYEVRTAPCRFTRLFEEEKSRLRKEGKKPDEVRQALELLNLGRLRIAAKGLVFNLKSLKDPAEPMTLPVTAARQKADGVFMAGQGTVLRGAATTLEALHRAICVDGMSRLDEIALPAARPAAAPGRPIAACDVAIVGMSCIFPKAGDLETYWDNIQNKVYAITEVPADRWDWRLYYDADASARDKITSKWGGFIDPIVFDPTRFRIPPRALKSIDPLQLFPLEVVRRALADAGYGDGNFDRDRTACIFGVAGGMGDLGLQYGVRSALPLLFERPPEEILSQLPEWTEDTFPGILANVVAGRIANCFDLGGPNFTVDAACGSGLTAVYAAVREIAAGSSDLAIVGASDVMQNPFGFLCFSKTRALSPSGRPRPFDAAADGIAIGEGIAAIVLKRLDLAERDGDRIYAVIRGVGASSDGQGSSMTAPQTDGQKRAFQHAYRQAGFPISGLGMLEAHGTGTTLGDSVEASTIRQAMADAGARPQSCAVGSVKSMIGHTKGCAGIAGLIKTALSLYHKVLPPTLGVSKPGPAACWGPDSPIYVNAETRPWIGGPDPRRAGVDAFGFGGSNFHTVLEEYRGEGRRPPAFPLQSWPCELFCWSGASAESLRGPLQDLVGKLNGGARPALRDLAAHVTKEGLRAPGPGGALVRLALVAESIDDLKTKLGAALDALKGRPESIRDPRGIYFSAAPLRRDGKVAFLFPGQASQRPDMMRGLAVLFPEMGDALAAADRATEGCYPKRLSEYIYPPPRFSPEDEKRCMAELTATHVTQPALGAVSIGLARIVGLLGIRPDMTAGHSVAEYVALCAAGVYDEDTLFRLLEFRGLCIEKHCGQDAGTMLAVKGTLADAQPVLAEFPDVHPANFNAPTQLILAGRKGDLDQVADRLKVAGVKSRPIAVGCAFHSPFVEPARGPLAGRIAETAFRTPAVPVYANALAEPYPEDPAAMRAVLAGHLVTSVRFTDEIRRMHADGARIFVEIGPGNVLTNLVGEILAGQPFVAVSCDAKSPRHDLFQLLQAMAQLAAEGAEVDPAVLFDRRAVRRLAPDTLMPAEPGAKPSPVSWMLAPDKAWPVGEKRPALTPIALDRPAAAPPLPAAGQARVPPAGSVGIPAPPELDGARAGALVRYQKLMAGFLEQQKEIMMAYLGARGPGSGAAAPAVEPGPAAAIPVPTVPAPAPAAAAPVAELAPAAPPGGSAPSEAAMTKALVVLVADRTGYPPEMLNLDLNIEGDLGIDSIKRVEILTAFGKTLPNPPANLAEQFAGARTLRQVIERAVGAGSPPAASAAPASAPAAASRPAPAPALTADALQKALVVLVADRTGYPPEMLNLDLNIEGDLGIDSIKRVEILTAFGKTLPDPPANLAEQFGGARTLRQVIEAAVRALGKVVETASDLTRDIAAPAAAAPRAVGPGSQDGIKRHLIRLDPSPLETAAACVIPAGVVIVTDDGRGCAAALRARLEGMGGKAVVVRLNGADGGDPCVLQANLGDPAIVESLVAEVRRRHGPIGGIVHLLPLRDAPAVDQLTPPAWQQYLGEEIKGFFYLLHYAAADLNTGAPKWVVACTSLGSESMNGRLPCPTRPWRGGLMGIVKTVAAEWPHARCKVIDMDAVSPDRVLGRILGEAGQNDRAPEVYYCDQRRAVPQVVCTPLDRSGLRIQLGAEDVILLIGGARGICAEVARALAERYRPTLLLAGRSGWPTEEAAETRGVDAPADLKRILFDRLRAAGGRPKPVDVEAGCRRILMDREMRTTRAALEAAGAKVAYYRADVQNADELAGLIDSIYAAHGRLDGVINGAGIIEDKLLEHKSPDSFDRVFDIKAQSVFLLSRLLRPESLKFVALFSSVAGWFGNRGQVDYAAANEVLNRMAMYLDHRWGKRVVAIGWGPWATTGMVSDGVRAQFKERGIDLIAPAAGSRYLMAELSYGDLSDALVIAQGHDG